MTSTPDPSSTRTVLLAEDEEVVAKLATRVLERAGFRVLHAADGVAATTCYDENAEEIGAVVLDLSMPELSGQQVLEHLRSKKPELPVILTSGYTPESLGDVPESPYTLFVQKPYKASALVDSLKKFFQ